MNRMQKQIESVKLSENIAQDWLLEAMQLRTEYLESN